MTEYETPRDDYTRWLEERVRAMTAQIGELERELTRRGILALASRAQRERRTAPVAREA
jgi:hypothetical protein